ncbi:uncharacterized protein LOC110846363 [Folsomia candida]|uniref:Uncharacterized protein n=1 Tax=Folsomia candida TaxID=158441 RepID=A0A226EK78_FOLCA|nr:uncharacterized protein LOC110846363 [Folsomia candida]OXA57507.1 hypothetical protein Fcan01_06771 [Folsomia candida]
MMESVKAIVLTLTILVVISIVTPAPPERKCRTVFTDLNKRELQQINVCTKELGYKSGREKSQKSTCTMKCVLTKESLIKPDGQLSAEQFDIYVMEHFPPSLIDRANETFNPCLALFDGKNIEQDEFCKSYDPLVKCLTRNFANLCRGLP